MTRLKKKISNKRRGWERKSKLRGHCLSFHHGSMGIATDPRHARMVTSEMVILRQHTDGSEIHYYVTEIQFEFHKEATENFSGKRSDNIRGNLYAADIIDYIPSGSDMIPHVLMKITQVKMRNLVYDYRPRKI